MFKKKRKEKAWALSCFTNTYFSLTISYTYIIYSCHSCPTLSYTPLTLACFPSHLSPTLLYNILFHFYLRPIRHNQYCKGMGIVLLMGSWLTHQGHVTKDNDFLFLFNPILPVTPKGRGASSVSPFPVYDWMFMCLVQCRRFAGTSCCY